MRPPPAGRSFWTRSPRWTSASRPSFCAPSRSAASGRWAGVEEVETDVRIIAACNADLPRYVEEGNSAPTCSLTASTPSPIHSPAAAGAEREDIPPLCRSLLDELSRKLKRRLELTPEAIGPACWPTTGRAMSGSCATCWSFCAYLTPSGVITELSLPENLRTGPTAQPSLTLAQRTRAFERAGDSPPISAQWCLSGG